MLQLECEELLVKNKEEGLRGWALYKNFSFLSQIQRICFVKLPVLRPSSNLYTTWFTCASYPPPSPHNFLLLIQPSKPFYPPPLYTSYQPHSHQHFFTLFLFTPPTNSTRPTWTLLHPPPLYTTYPSHPTNTSLPSFSLHPLPIPPDQHFFYASHF